MGRGQAANRRGSGVKRNLWLDEVFQALPANAKVSVRDSKTPSGPIPFSALRGPIISDALARHCLSRGLDVSFDYTFDDYDPADSLTLATTERGKPLCDVLAPNGQSYAVFNASPFIDALVRLGITPRLAYMSDVYRQGLLDVDIERVLNAASLIRNLYEQAGVHKDARWLPVDMICEQCGRLATTLATGFNGTEVTYACTLTTPYVAGCSYQGSRSPYAGGAKLPWHLQWCAQWRHFGTSFEECGKDLGTAGGSRQRAEQLYKEVWQGQPPVNPVHEFVTWGGKKISTSDSTAWERLGVGASSLVNVLPPALTRFLFLRTPPGRHIALQTVLENLPQLHDEYEKAHQAYKVDTRSVEARIFISSQPSNTAPLYVELPRLGVLAEWVQLPNVNVLDEASTWRGRDLDAEEKSALDERIALARLWLERWAPANKRYAVSPTLPEGVSSLSSRQQDFLEHAAVSLPRSVSSPEAFQVSLYDLARSFGFVAPDGRVESSAFEAIYISLLGTSFGPRAAWLLASLPFEFVHARLLEAAQA